MKPAAPQALSILKPSPGLKDGANLDSEIALMAKQRAEQKKRMDLEFLEQERLLRQNQQDSMLKSLEEEMDVQEG